MRNSFRVVAGLALLAASVQAGAQITFYEGESFHGRAFTTDRATPDFRRTGFNDRASSVIVDRGRWEACDDAGFRGHCVVLREGNYDSLQRLGMNDRISSARRLGDSDRIEQPSPEPLAAPTYDYRRRPNEQVYEAHVSSVRAVVGPGDRRCWVERDQVQEDRGKRNLGGGIVGALIGGVIGHQIGGGRGRDLATVGGVAAGAAIGSNQGRGGGEVVDRDVRHCETAADGPPAYWDVEYQFHDVDHRVQMTAPPGATILVNRDGEPRQ